MSEESNVMVENQQTPNQKKKKSKGWLVGLVIFLLIFIVIPGSLALLCYDTGMMDITYDENFDKNHFTSSLVNDSFDNVKDDGYLKFSVSESDINNLIYSTYKDNTQLRKYLKQFAIDVKEDTYVFNISAKLGFYQTKLKITTRLEKTMIENSHGVEEEAYSFAIKDIKLGKLPIAKGLTKFVLKKAISEEVINSFYNSPLKLNVDIDNLRLYIFTSDFSSVINESMANAGGSSDYGSFLASFIDDFLKSQLLDFDFYSNDSLTAQIDLNKIAGNDYDEGQYVCYTMPYESTSTKLTFGGEQKKLSLDTIRDALVVLLNNGLIQKGQMNEVSEYLFNGYHDSNAPACDLSIIGINNKNTYKGFNLYGSTSIDTMVTNSVSDFNGYNPMMNSFQIASITESDINQYLHSQRIFGNKFFLTNKVEENDYKSSYVAFDNAYLNLTTNNAVISVGVNVNGFETILTMLLDKDDNASGGSKLVYNTSELYFGDTKEGGERISASDGTKSLMFQTLGSSVNCSSFSFSSDGKMTIDFSALVNQATTLISASEFEYKEFLLNSNTTIDVSVDGNNIADNSVIKIVANRH